MLSVSTPTYLSFAVALIIRRGPVSSPQLDRVKNSSTECAEALESAPALDAVGNHEMRVEVARTVELCEMILSNRRLISMRNPAKRRMLRGLEMKSFSMAFESRLWRIVFRHLRRICDRDDDDGPVALFARILFAHEDSDLLSGRQTRGRVAWEKFQAYSDSSGHRNTYAAAVTDVRAWALRKLMLRPESFAFTLLCAHFCTSSAKYSDAVAVYTRAHRMQPSHAMTCLCLGVSYLSFAMSRTAVRRHDLVLKGFTFIQRYRRLRLQESEVAGNEAACNDIEARVVRAETSYNLGRAFHQLEIRHLAVTAYSSALMHLESVVGCGNCAAEVLRRSCASNLAQLYLAQGSRELARETVQRHIVF